ncbi:hypothetical protein ETU09_01375 [Apibacter muscae]|uniref:Glycosyltransferase RgtA/B/C/D-like domain-containing protein n=1 Tax=Apibacter muscae TaxID=2509004 RepID=A0A563DL58_9FLAO|nr:hypothetical protein [Apibacter muscae]TWP30681.1 hypothetical protein ETU09_01375 [Apibacter muscae]
MKKNIYLLPAITAIIYLVINLVYVYFRNFDEDAYILFRYVEMAVDGNGIVFYPGGEHTEGATDFLWLILLIILGKIGINVGVGAIILNSFGVYIINYIFFKTLCKGFNYKISYFIAFPIATFWILFYPIIAALGGFSVILYSSLIVLLSYFLYNQKFINLIPYLGLTISLFRPDGAIIAVTSTILGFLISYKKYFLKKYFFHSLIALTLSIIYFIWRFNYFEEILPLPIYVKSNGGILQNILSNLKILLFNKQALIFTFLFLLSLIFIKKIRFRLLFAFFPVLIHFLIFTFMHQSQNVGFRFQAPFFLVLYYLLILITIFIALSYRNIYIVLILPLLMLITSIKTYKHYYYTLNTLDYINQFTFFLSRDILKGNETLYITEAGRFAYWNTKPNKIIDVVGLNNRYYAKKEAPLDNSKDKIDILMCYWGGNSKPFSFFQNNIIYKFTNINQFQNIIHDYITQNKHSSEKTVLATMNILSFLSKNFNDYDIILVKMGGETSAHVYGINKKINISNDILKLLIWSNNHENYKSYINLIQLRKHLK